MLARIGTQTPRVWHRPGGRLDFADGDEAVDLGAAYGMVADEWQASFVRDALARTADGRLAVGTCGQAVPRQNGKNAEIEIIQLHKMVMQGRRILHTAHEVKTAKKAFNRLKSFFENQRRYPELADMVLAIRETNGQEAIFLHAAGCPVKGPNRCGCDREKVPSCEFSARSRGAARGFTVDDLFCDEAQELTDEQQEALLPTISAAPSGDPQQYYFGTPPSEMMLAEVFRRVRKDGVSGRGRRSLWQEWSVADDLDPHEGKKFWRKYAYDTNPALGVRISEQTVADEAGSMSPEGFCRERLGQWLSRFKAGPFPVGTWEAGVDPTSEIAAGSDLVWAVEVSVNRSMAHVVVAGFRGDGLPHVEVVASRAGVDWVPGWFADRVDRYDGMSLVVQKNGAPASGLIPDLKAVDGVSVHEWAGPELGNWTGKFFDLVARSKAPLDGEGRVGVAHLPQPVLDVAAVNAVIVYLAGGAPMIDRKRGPVDVTPLVGAVGAVGKLLEKEKAPEVSAYESGSFLVV